MVIDASTSAPVTQEIPPHVEPFAPVTAVANPVPNDPQSAAPESTVPLALTASDVAGFATNDAPSDERDAVETAAAPAEAGCPSASVAEGKESEPAQHSTAQWMGLAAAAVIAVALMGIPLGVWLGTRHRSQPEPRQTVAPAVQKAAVEAAPVAAASAPTKSADVLAPKAQTVADGQPKTGVPGLPLAKASSRTPPKAARKFETTRPSAPQPVPVPVVPGLAAMPASSVVAPPSVVESPRIVAPMPPAGRLFEPADVDESPRVATRVEPQLPDDAVTRFPKDIVVVRVLVSQGGHPFRVSLLRRSLGGRSLDDAVVAAVSQWTFSPARKRGEAVSCWMNFGVPIGR